MDRADLATPVTIPARMEERLGVETLAASAAMGSVTVTGTGTGGQQDRRRLGTVCGDNAGLEAVCGGARRASTGNCLNCLGAHFACAARIAERFCSGKYVDSQPSFAEGLGLLIGLTRATEREIVVDVKRVGQPVSRPTVTLVK